MKTTFMLCILLAIAGCQKLKDKIMPAPHSVLISTLSDKSEKDMTAPTGDEILSLANLDDDHLNDQTIVRYREMGEVGQQKVTEYRVALGDPLQSDPSERVRTIRTFTWNVRQLFKEHAEPTEKMRSQIYLAVATECNIVANSKVDQRYILIFSDMLDNGTFNFYDYNTQQLIHNHPDRLMEQMNKLVPIQSLNGIEIRIVFNPVTYEQEQRFIWSSGYYKSLLESKGAHVVVVPNLETNK